MARQPRLYAEGYAQLISVDFSESTQRSLQSFDSQPYPELLNWLGRLAPLHQVAVHGWAVTPRSMVILATPEASSSLPSLVQALGRNLAAHLRSGSVFAGRYHSTIPQPGLWVLPSLIWLELHPVREKLVEDAESWPWSSARTHTGAPGGMYSWLQPHPDYWLCGNTPFDRQANYRRKLSEGLPSASDRQISTCLRGQWALGDERFMADLQKTATRRVQPGVRGRPKKQ